MFSGGWIRIGECTPEQSVCMDLRTGIANAAMRVALESQIGSVDHSDLLSIVYGVPVSEVLEKIDTDADRIIESREAYEIQQELRCFFSEMAFLPPHGGVFDRFYRYAEVTPTMRARLIDEFRMAVLTKPAKYSASAKPKAVLKSDK